MKKIIILLCIPFFFLRCDSFLDVNPDSEVVNDDMFNSASGVEDALYGVYMTMVTKVWTTDVHDDTGDFGTEFHFDLSVLALFGAFRVRAE